MQPGLSQRMLANPQRALARARASRCARQQVKVVAVFEKFTERSIKSVMIGQQVAKTLGCHEVTTEHILLGLIEEEGQSKHGYMNSGLSYEQARREVDNSAASGRPAQSHATIPFSTEVKKTFEVATNECKLTGVSTITPEHILLAIVMQYNCKARKVLERCNLDIEAMRQETLRRIKGATPPQKTALDKKLAATGASGGQKEAPKALAEFCRDLCADVAKGKIDPVIGREDVVSRVIQILARRTKNNPILLGEPGVGKTAIAEGLACAIVHQRCPDGSPLPSLLLDKHVMQLDVGLLISGAKERGELEMRITQLIAETKSRGDVILMIDEIHTLVGAGVVRGGGSGSGLDLSNMLKPALARGELQCIGATTLGEHRKHIERDAALERRFQPVMVHEPEEAATLAILAGLRERYERHHCCRYTEEALQAAVHLSQRYITDRFLPDKAIDLMDEAGSRVRIRAHNARKETHTFVDPSELREYIQVLEAKEEAVQGQLFEEASILARREEEYRGKLAGSSEAGAALPVVTAAEIEAIVTAWTGIPVERLAADDLQRLARMDDHLKQRIIGQDDAVESMCRALLRAHSGLKDPSRPIASLLFVGPTGVGKTELTKEMADYMFGSRDAIIRLDMSEYMERHSVSKILGSPPGYVGYGDGGTLTEAVRRRPSSIVLFDEVEKAHPDVLAFLLQIMEDGRLTDSQGRTVSFKNTLVVLTSNIGSSVIAGTSHTSYRGETFAAPTDNARMVQLVQTEVRKHFRPEFMNRLDEVVVFNKLERPEVARIARLMVQESSDRLRQVRDIGLELSEPMMDRVLREGYSEEWGVRPLRAVITRLVDDPVCDALLRGDAQAGGRVVVDSEEDGEVEVWSGEEWEQRAGSLASRLVRVDMMA